MPVPAQLDSEESAELLPLVMRIVLVSAVLLSLIWSVLSADSRPDSSIEAAVSKLSVSWLVSVSSAETPALATASCILALPYCVQRRN